MRAMRGVLALGVLALVGAVVCVAIISNAPVPSAAVELSETDSGSSIFNALETSGPYHNSYVKAPSMEQLAGHDHNPNDNSLRLHLLARYVQKKMQKDPPQKQQLNGLWERLAYARRVLGADANEILGPQTRDSKGNIIRISREEQERRDNANTLAQHLRQQSRAMEPRRRQLNRLRRLLRSKYHLSNKKEALAMAEQNAERDAHQSFATQRMIARKTAARLNNEERSLLAHPGAERALNAVDPEAEENEPQPQQQQQQQLSQAEHHQQLAIAQKAVQKKQQAQRSNVQPLRHVVKDDSSQKLVIEGGPLSTAAGPLAVVGWLHKAKDGDWAGKLYAKSSPQGLAALRSPMAGGLGWFDGTVTAAQLKAQQPAPVVAPAPAISEVPVEEVYESSNELSQPMYAVAPTQYTSATMDPQIDTNINPFEIEPGLQLN